MFYQSTRSDRRVTDTAAILEGIAPDGGLYIDPSLSDRPFDWKGCLALSPLGMAEAILSHLLPGFADMGGLVRRAYDGKFDSDELTPLMQVGDDYVLELFHGPTAAFKDVALSMLPQLVTAARVQEGVKDKIVILTATSGDTGKAALEGFHDVEGTGILVFYPDAGVSPVQKAQMVTQVGANVKVCAVRGNFDDCQTGVKRAFAALKGDALPAGCRLSSANSINIGRLAPQVVYYFIAYAALLRRGAIRMGQQPRPSRNSLGTGSSSRRAGRTSPSAPRTRRRVGIFPSRPHARRPRTLRIPPLALRLRLSASPSGRRRQER